MKSIADIMAEKLKVEEKPKRGGINSPRSEVAGQLLVFMGEDKTLDEEKKLEAMTPGAGKAAKKKRLNQRIKYWPGRTKKLEPKAIYGLMSQAKEGKNRAALFNYLLKNYGQRKDKEGA